MNTKFNLDEEIKKCKTMEDLTGKNGLIKRILKDTIEKILQEEMNHSIGYKKHSPDGYNSGNNRNGSYAKNLRTSSGELTIEVPRDRNGNFEPRIVPKYNKDITEFDQKIISMYAKGMTTRDIQDHVYDIYGAEISPTMVSMITDKVMGMALEWQNRPLESQYVIIYFDAIHYKVRSNGKIECKAAYCCLGINMEGKKEIIGIWIGENEGARYWLSVINELKTRGIKDILIACMDGLKGLPDAIKSVFPQTEIQLCVIHMIRNSLKYIGSKNRKEFMDDLKKVYQAVSENEASYTLEMLSSKWGKQYPLAVNPWITHWENISGYFKYPFELRRIIYTTNTVESLHRQFRKVTKNRAVLANDEALFKLLFLAGQDAQDKWQHTVRDWGIILTQLNIFFEGRINVA